MGDQDYRIRKEAIDLQFTRLEPLQQSTSSDVGLRSVLDIVGVIELPVLNLLCVVICLKQYESPLVWMLVLEGSKGQLIVQLFL